MGFCKAVQVTFVFRALIRAVGTGIFQLFDREIGRFQITFWCVFGNSGVDGFLPLVLATAIFFFILS